MQTLAEFARRGVQHIPLTIEAARVVGRRDVANDQADAIIDLRGAHLAGGDFRGAMFRGALLSKADLKEANFDGAVLAGADLEDADVIRTSFCAGANLEGSTIHMAKRFAVGFFYDNSTKCHIAPSVLDVLGAVNRDKTESEPGPEPDLNPEPAPDPDAEPPSDPDAVEER